MACRPVFLPETNQIGVKTLRVDFDWSPGFAISQKIKNVSALHKAAAAITDCRILEISSKSTEELGVQLSAFNLSAKANDQKRVFTVETAFQSSKVFENGGPYKDLLYGSSIDAKKDSRIRSSGRVISFVFSKKKFPTWPLTYFYDWLYAQFLIHNNKLANNLLGFGAFTDIEFNPDKSINCQAHSAALFMSMISNGTSSNDISDPESFLNLTSCYYRSTAIFQTTKISSQNESNA